MHVLILGATGSIGTAVAAELLANGHHIIALARSDQSKTKLQTLGYETITGNIRDPSGWSDIVLSVDAIIQVAVTSSDDMGTIDRHLIEELQRKASPRTHPLRMLYTGGCWLYGATGDNVADEKTPFNPIQPFAWMVDNADFLLASPVFNTTIIHPAMVYSAEGGVFHRFVAQAKNNHAIEVWGHPNARWPLVHRNDLAVAYRLLLEDKALTGHYNVVAEQGVRVGEIAQKISKQFANSQPFTKISTTEAMARYGDWAKGPTLDQQMSAEKLMRATNWQPKENFDGPI